MKKLALLLTVSSLVLVSCKKEVKEETPAADTTVVAKETPPEKKAFDLASIPVSEAKLKPAPYFDLPGNYKFGRQKTTENESLRFWTGAQFESPKGQVFDGRIVPVSGPFSGKELTDALAKSFTDAGAVKVFEGKVPTDAITAYIAKNGEKNSIDFLDAYGFQGYANSWMYVLKQKDKTLWIQLNESDDNASMLMGIVESKNE